MHLPVLRISGDAACTLLFFASAFAMAIFRLLTGLLCWVFGGQ